MKNKLQTIGILFVFLVVLIFIATIATKKSDDEILIDEITENQTYQVTSFNSNDIVKLDFSQENGVDTYDRTEDGWVLENSSLPINQSVLSYSCNAISNFSSIEKFDTTQNDYGTTDSPIYITAYLKDDSTIKLTFGAKTPDGVYDYIKVEGSDNDGIYMLPTVSAEFMFLTKDTAAFKTFEQIDFETLNKIVINQKDYQNLVLEIPTDASNPEEHIQGVSELIMTSPYENKTIFMQNFVDDVFSTITALEFGELIENDCDDLSKYGLDNPYLSIEIISDNNSLQLEVGDAYDDFHYYVKYKNSNNIFLMTKELLAPFIDIDCYSFLNKFLMLNAIDTVDNIKITDSTNTYTIEKNIVNNIDVDESVFTNLYKAIVSIQLSLYTDDLSPSDIYQTYIFTFNDGSIKEYNFYKYDSQYCSYYDDEAKRWTLVSLSDLDAVIGTIKNIIE